MASTQAVAPNGVLRCTERRKASSTFGVSSRSTASAQPAGLGSGQGSSSRAGPRRRSCGSEPCGQSRADGDQAGAQRVALDIAADGDEVRVVLDQERLVAALVEMALAGGAVAAVPGLGMALGQAADEAAQIAVDARPEDEVPVVGHQAPGEQAHARPGPFLGEQGGELAVVDLVVEQGRPGIGAVEHMVDQAADVGTGGAWHGRRITEVVSSVKSPDPFCSRRS